MKCEAKSSKTFNEIKSQLLNENNTMNQNAIISNQDKDNNNNNNEENIVSDLLSKEIDKLDNKNKNNNGFDSGDDFKGVF